MSQKTKITKKIRKSERGIHSSTTQRGNEIIILFNCLHFFHSCDDNVMMRGSHPTYSDLLGMGLCSGLSIFKTSLGDYNMQQILSAIAHYLPLTCSSRSYYILGWAMTNAHRTHWESVIIIIVHQHKRKSFNYKFILKGYLQ